MCDELMALVQHLFTEEEAGVVRHLGLFSGRAPPSWPAPNTGPLDQIEPILDRLANEKRVIACSGGKQTGRSPAYRLLPIVPGIFEMMLIGHTPESLTDWHRRFIELFEALYETGYSLDYSRHPTPSVRYPAGGQGDRRPSDGAALRQAGSGAGPVRGVRRRAVPVPDGDAGPRPRLRQTAGQLHGDGPVGRAGHRGRRAPAGLQERSPGNQTRGRIARAGQLDDERAIDPRAMLLLVLRLLLPRHADGQRVQRAGLRSRRRISCRGSTGPDASTAASAPRIARWARSSSTRGRRTYTHLRERCIGCGLCVLACDRQRALVMEPVPDYRLPYRSWFSLIAHALPGTLMTSWKVWRQRRSVEGRFLAVANSAAIQSLN